MNTREKVTCPVCEGTKEVRLTDEERRNWGYRDQTHRACPNCGGQTMWGKATGLTFLREDGTPCRHEYRGSQRGRCYVVYSCRHCPDSFDIDSGD